MILPEVEKQIYTFMAHEIREQGCYLEAINGMPDHVHMLFLLSRTKSVADVMKQVKGSSSRYINEQELISQKFEWQTGYAAFSISESGVKKVKAYIENQKQHHLNQSFSEEYEAFRKLYGL